MGSLDFLYGTAAGRALLRPLVSRPVSKLAGAFLDTPLSRPLIPLFVKNCGIDTEDYDLRQIRCFNDFFCRPLKSGRRPIDPDPVSLIAPCDGLLTAVPIEADMVLLMHYIPRFDLSVPYFIVMFVMACLFVGRFKIRKPGRKGVWIMVGIGFAEFVAFMILMSVTSR